MKRSELRSLQLELLHNMRHPVPIRKLRNYWLIQRGFEQICGVYI